MKSFKNKSCDIIIPIKDDLEDLRACLNSIVKHTKYLYRLTLIDDSSDEYTKNFLKSFVQKHKASRLITNQKNLGFVKSCSKGMKIAKSKYILLLNSDTIVTPNWLTKMIACADSDPKIGIVSPLSNRAPNLSIDIPPGNNIFTAAQKIEEISGKDYPDITTAVGFCFMITKKALKTLGVFDEIYGMGYCEESDYCMRAVSKGFRVVAADDTFIYHRRTASFKNRDKRYRKNREIFDRRWKDAYLRDFEEFQKRNPLGYLRENLYPKKAEPSIGGMLNVLKRDLTIFLRAIKVYGIKSTFRKSLQRIKKGNTNLFFYLRKYGVKKIVKAQCSKKNKVKILFNQKKIKEKRLKVVFILNTLDIRGGVISVVQMVNELTLLGVDAKIATCHKENHMRNFKLYTQPIIFTNKREMIRNFPQTDIVVATFWTTAYEVREIVKRNPKIIPFYFIQDYEAWFYPEENKKIRQKVVDTYKFIFHKMVKTQWLAKKLQEIGYETHKIFPGMNLDIFYPRRRINSKRKRILGMARPATPYRGFADMIEVFKLVKKRRPDVKIVFFGIDDLSDYHIPFGYTNVGIVRDDDLARLYSSCDVYLDCSWFHGFGRTGLEAMACGTSYVLTESGGVSEYARDNYNALLAPVNDVKKLAEAVVKLLDNPRLRHRLIQNGLKTAQQYPYQRTAKQVKKLFLNALNFKD